MEVTLNINGVNQKTRVEPGEVLLDTLRALGLKSVKKGCDTGTCGVCTVLVDHKIIPSCSYFTMKAEGKEILTIEGIEKDARVIGGYITAEGADQCGFCTPGLIMSIYSIPYNVKDYSDAAIKKYLVGNLCRCTGYEGQMRGVKKYLQEVIDEY